MFVHLEVDIKTLSFVLAILDGSCHRQEAVGGCQVPDEVGPLMTRRVIIVSQGHVDTMTSNGLILGVQTGVEDLNGLLVRIDSKTSTLKPSKS